MAKIARGRRGDRVSISVFASLEGKKQLFGKGRMKSRRRLPDAECQVWRLHVAFVDPPALTFAAALSPGRRRRKATIHGNERGLSLESVAKHWVEISNILGRFALIPSRFCRTCVRLASKTLAQSSPYVTSRMLLHQDNKSLGRTQPRKGEKRFLNPRRLICNRCQYGRVTQHMAPSVSARVCVCVFWQTLREEKAAHEKDMGGLRSRYEEESSQTKENQARVLDDMAKKHRAALENALSGAEKDKNRLLAVSGVHPRLTP